MPDDAPTAEYLELTGGRVHLFRGGSGEPVLFLHAAGGAGAWMEFHGHLAGAGFDVIAPDHPGFAMSDDFPLVEAMDDLVYHYLDVLDALGLERVHVVGASFGGWIAAELAVAASHRLRSLTLLSAAGLRLPEHPVPDIFLMPPPRPDPGLTPVNIDYVWGFSDTEAQHWVPQGIWMAALIILLPALLYVPVHFPLRHLMPQPVRAR